MIGCLYIVSVTKWDPRVNKAFQIVMVFEHNAYVLAIPHSYRLLRELEYFSVEHEDNYTLKKKKKRSSKYKSFCLNVSCQQNHPWKALPSIFLSFQTDASPSPSVAQRKLMWNALLREDTASLTATLEGLCITKCKKCSVSGLKEKVEQRTVLSRKYFSKT